MRRKGPQIESVDDDEDMGFALFDDGAGGGGGEIDSWISTRTAALEMERAALESKSNHKTLVADSKSARRCLREGSALSLISSLRRIF